MAAKFPSYRHHKASGRAYVQWKPLYGEKRHYLPGKHNSPESLDAYAEILKQVNRPIVPSSLPRPSEVRRVCDLIVQFQLRKGFGKSNGKYLIRPLLKVHGLTRLEDFGPLALQEVRDYAASLGWSIGYVNQGLTRARAVFKWGVVNEYFDPSKFRALELVEGVKAGETKATSRPKIKPVEWSHVEPVLAKLSPMVAAMVQIHGLTGMRSGELTGLTLGEIDRTGDVWIYRKSEHKTAHRGKEKIICFGPRAQALLAPYLNHGGEFIFSPRIAEQERKSARAAARKTPIYGKAKTGKPAFQSTRNRYDSRSYYRTLQYAFVTLANERQGNAIGERERPPKGCDRRAWLAERGVISWHPHQLRHARATDTRAAYGLEAAQAQLGNSLEATQIYAETSLALQIKIARETG